MRVLFITPSLGDAYGQERILRESNELLRAAGHETHFWGAEKVGPVPPCHSHQLLSTLNQINTLTPLAQVRSVTKEIENYLVALNPDVVHFIDQFDHRIMKLVSRRFPSLLTAHTVAPTCPSSQRYILSAGGICQKKSGWTCLINHCSYHCLQHFKSPIHQAHAIYEFKLKRRALKKFSSIAAISNYVQDSLLRDGFSKDQVSIVSNPVWIDTKNLKPLPSAPENLLVVASRLVKLKGIDFLLRDLHQIKHLKWTLWVFGEGPEQTELQKLTNDLELQSRVFFKGRKNSQEIYEAMLASHAFIQPNRGPEGFGMSVAEASFLGIPVICYDVPALNEIVTHRKTGLLVPLPSKNGLVGAIEEILNDSHAAKKMGQEGALQVRKNYSREQHLMQTLALYQKCRQRNFKGSVSETETFSLNPNDIQETF